ncbi:hypothetical protein [Aquibacillus rhizosphaerae]|uniref:Uncharacterized protein n=1 Tax=Aquibacillus rhizosphaerae TaxID=3051431 RepID=A0ABT7LB63_9BACI|nr:hypothetical protein [Aquibacillus sp. LR5S19]MDL4843092.1 hypothetical protein [Aquibacillus sp. LR5S19]
MGVAPMISIIAQRFVGFLSGKYKTIKGLLIILYFLWNIIIYYCLESLRFFIQFVGQCTVSSIHHS